LIISIVYLLPNVPNASQCIVLFLVAEHFLELGKITVAKHTFIIGRLAEESVQKELPSLMYGAAASDENPEIEPVLQDQPADSPEQQKAEWNDEAYSQPPSQSAMKDKRQKDFEEHDNDDIPANRSLTESPYSSLDKYQGGVPDAGTKSEDAVSEHDDSPAKGDTVPGVNPGYKPGTDSEMDSERSDGEDESEEVDSSDSEDDDSVSNSKVEPVKAVKHQHQQASTGQ